MSAAPKSQATNEARSREPERDRIVAGAAERIAAQVGADAASHGQLGEQRQQERARAGAEIGDLEGGVARLRAIERLERGFDHGLGLRSRHQGRGIELEIQPPEFLDPDDARHRLACEAARRQRGDRIGLAGIERARGLGGEARMVEAERVRHQEPRIQLGRG